MIPFVRDFAFEYGRADALSPLIRRVIARNPGPFTFTGTGTYIVGPRTLGAKVAVIDPGPAEAAAPGHLQAILDAVAGQRVTHILVTHSHLDHSPLAAPLKAETGAPILGRSAGSHASSTAPDEPDQAAFRPDVELADGERLSGPGWTLETVATPGHASNHLCFALPEETALFSGDHVMGWSTTVVSPPDGDMGDYLRSLDRLIGGGYETLWPAHGPPVIDPAPFLAAYRAHRSEREAQILEALREGPARIADLIPRLYAEVDPHLWPAAGQSVWAHLIHLIRSYRVETQGAAEFEGVYRLR